MLRIYFTAYILIGLITGFLVAYSTKKNRLQDEHEVEEFAEIMVGGTFIWPLIIAMLIITSIWKIIKIIGKRLFF